MKSTSVLREFINKELFLSAPDLDEETRSKLSNIANAFLQNQISMISALTVFSDCSCPPTVITKIAHIKSVGEQPLPAPEQTSVNEPSDLMSPSSSRRKGTSWSTAEDMRLLIAVSRYGCHDWVMVAAFVGGGRTSSQCNQRWTRALNPSISRQPWSPEEDTLLINIVEKKGECGWRKIATQLEGRTDLQCRHRYLQMKRAKTMKKESSRRVLPFLLANDERRQLRESILLESIPMQIGPFTTHLNAPDCVVPSSIVKRGKLSCQ